MTNKTLTGTLEEEHRHIETVVALLPMLIEVIEAGRRVEAGLFREIVEFMRTFTDRCHQEKEEVLLFPVLAQKGVPVAGCSLGALTHEHQQGRALVSGLAEAAQAYARGDAVAIASLVENLRGIAELYPHHIWREDYLLFPMMNMVLDDDDEKDLLEKFAQADATMGHDTDRRFEEMALELESLVLQASAESRLALRRSSSTVPSLWMSRPG